MASDWSADTRERIERLCGAVETYETLATVMFAETTEAGATEVEKLPGVIDSRPTTIEKRNLVWAVNHQLLIAEAHGGTLMPNGVAKAAPPEHCVRGRPSYPTLTARNGEVHWGWDPEVKLPTRACLVGALNISLEMRSRAAYDAADPINLALTEASARYPVALAAGNINSDPNPTMFGWPLNPAVIAVGAVDPDGIERLSCSRVGDPAAGNQGPDVVADGTDASGEEGTSFATPVAASQLAQLGAALMAIRSASLATTEDPEGIPLAGRCFVDFDRALGDTHAHKVTDFADRRRQLPALPREVVTPEARLAVASTPLSGLVRGRPSAELARQLLLRSARPVPAHDSSTVGAGFVSDNTTVAFLAGLTIESLAAFLGTPAPGNKQHVFEPDLLEAFLEGTRDSMLGWANGITDFTHDGGVLFVEPT